MQQQSSGAQRIFVEDIALFVGADVHVINEGFSILDLNVAFLQTALTRTQAFYLCTSQRNTGLYGFFDKVVMICFFVLRDQFCTLRLCHTVSPSSLLSYYCRNNYIILYGKNQMTFPLQIFPSFYRNLLPLLTFPFFPEKCQILRFS